jgi:hypothetical protein
LVTVDAAWPPAYAYSTVLAAADPAAQTADPSSTAVAPAATAVRRITPRIAVLLPSWGG